MFYWGQKVWSVYELWWRSHAGYTDKLRGWEEYTWCRPLAHSFYDKRVLKNRIVFPEDRLRARYYKKYPEEVSQYPQNLLFGEMKYFQPPVEIFVKKQLALMKKGLSEEEAFRICVKEKEMEADALNLERELLKQQAQVLFGLPEVDWNERIREIQKEYESAAEKAAQIQKLKKRKELLELVDLKLRTNDTTPIQPEDIPDMPFIDVVKFFRNYPQAAHLFDPMKFLLRYQNLNYLKSEGEEPSEMETSKDDLESETLEKEKEAGKKEKKREKKDKKSQSKESKTETNQPSDRSDGISLTPLKKLLAKESTNEDFDNLQKETFEQLEKLFNEMQIDLSNPNIPWTTKADALHLVSYHNPDLDITQPYYSDDTLRVLDEMKKDFLSSEGKPHFPTPKQNIKTK